MSGIEEPTDHAGTVQLTLDGEQTAVEANRLLITVAREHGSYVPGWCHHPGMRPASELESVDRVYRAENGTTTTPPRGVPWLDADEVDTHGERIDGADDGTTSCDMCLVEVNGEPVRACETRVRPGMDVRTDTERVRAAQESAMAEIFRHHPHACLNCPQKEGCDRITCSMNVPEEKRCCDLLGNCELEKSAEAIDLNWNDVPAYEPLDRPAQTTPVFDINWELCIGCGRCVGACEDHVGAGVWKFTVEADSKQGQHSSVAVGMKNDSLAKSGCKFCTTCVDACPTGTLMDNDGSSNPNLPTEFRESLPAVKFPQESYPFDPASIQTVPNAAGVYRLYDADGECVDINGVPDLAAELMQEYERTEAAEFEYELHEAYTTRETELIEHYVNEHGHMPGAGGAMDDLF